MNAFPNWRTHSARSTIKRRPSECAESHPFFRRCDISAPKRSFFLIGMFVGEIDGCRNKSEVRCCWKCLSKKTWVLADKYRNLKKCVVFGEEMSHHKNKVVVRRTDITSFKKSWGSARSKSAFRKKDGSIRNWTGSQKGSYSCRKRVFPAFPGVTVLAQWHKFDSSVASELAQGPLFGSRRKD